MLLTAATPLYAVDVIWNQSVDNNYANPDNWSTGFRPVFFLDEVGVIGSSTTPAAVANLSSTVLDDPAGVILGQATGTSGTLNIQDGGVLAVVPGTSAPGAVVVGGAGAGELNVAAGGTLTAEALVLNAGSQLTASGASTIALSADASLDGETRLAGPGVDFSIGADLNLGGGSSLISEITGTEHSTIDVTGTATLGGTLAIEFSEYDPVAGAAWDLIDASAVTGGFASVTSSGTDFNLGEQLVVQTVEDSNSANGVVVRLSIELDTLLVLQVDPQTGRARLFNESDEFQVDITGYDVSSASGSLNEEDGGWSSLDDQDAAGGDWRESNVSSNRIAELKQGGETAFAVSGATSFDLGDLFDVGGTQDLVFQYLVAGESQPIPGLVIYETIASGIPGDYNNDGAVDAADFTVWRDSLNAPPGALPNDNTGGPIGVPQYEVWRASFGTTPPPPGSAIPEPAAVLLLLAGLISVGRTWKSPRTTS